MTIETGAIVEAMRAYWPGMQLKDARRLTGGQWADMVHIRVTGTPEGVPADLVLRVVPQPEMGAKELAVQTAVADAGVRTPQIRLHAGAGGPLGGAWAVMDFAPGAPLLAGLDGVAALRRLPSLFAGLPGQLADTMAAVHRVDPEPVIRRVRDAAPTPALTVDEQRTHLRAGAEAAERADLAAALDRLADTQPSQSGAVLCHGDLHPLNLLADGERITIVDWTAAIVAPPAFDVAFTHLLVGHPPLTAPRPLRPVIGVGAAALARRFVARYHRANPTADLGPLGWYAALHAARILIDLAIWQRDGDPRADHHPWRLVAPGATSALRRATGVRVRPA